MNAEAQCIAKFRIGNIYTTPNALSKLSQDDVLNAIQRHQAGDWGDVDSHDREANNCALTEGTRLFSVYHSSKVVKFWVITEADRSATTVLMPEDY